MSTCLRCGGEVSASDIQCAKCGEALRKQTHELVGKSLADKYLIEEHLGSGGMCDVYRATHSGMGKQVAVKVLKPALAADSTIAQRFEQEARAASLIHHPHAINVMDYGIGEGNIPFIVMEFVRGITIGELLRSEGALSVERAANILRQASGALDVAHSVGVVHRDIKPDNIIIAEYDGSDWVEVVDFGVAKIQEDVNRRINLTGANIIVGTPRYMSPEQCEEKPVDARSDIYSLGIVLYEMLSNEAPFKGDSSTRLLVAHSTEPPEPLRNKRPDLQPEIEAVVMRALEKDPARRPQSAGEFAREFQEAAGLGQPVQAGTNRAGAFSRISVPIGEEDKLKTPVAAQASVSDTLEDEATIVRPRPVQATVALSDTPANQNLDTPVPVSEAAYQQRHTPPATYVAAGGYRKQSNTGAIIALVAVIVVVAGIAAYIVFGNKLSGRGSTGEAVTDAQQSVTEAIARVDSLPKDHPLRSYINELRQWQGELKAYQEVREDNAQVTEKADRYRQKAQDISDQARAALAALGVEAKPAQTNTAPASSSATTQPEAAEKPAADETADADDKEKTKDANDDKAVSDLEEASKNENKNKSKPRNAEPPVIDPVKPPSESEP
ncbi:MAG TPA: serine/threonine-protein kinase, partial [Blastocatellia bacterium]|nr:serine/threonine-protein kinase [Blastocatellia bacterium]